MASNEVQESWTGSSGRASLAQTVSFVRSISDNYEKFIGRPLTDASILDYGCGYGRIARLMYYFADEDAVFGCDPWDKSIAICKQDGLGANFVQSDYLPESLPVGARKFDLMYAFSVFTHLSEKAARMALRALRRCVADDGLLVVTIRPVEFWDFRTEKFGVSEVARLKSVHADCGFAFRPHPSFFPGGESDYGDTSLTFDWLKTNIPEWQMVGIDPSPPGGFQTSVFLGPKTD